MFGRMTVDRVLEVGANCTPNAAVDALVQASEKANVSRWIEFPEAILVFLFVPGDPQSGAVYVLDRKHGTWLWVNFDDDRYGGYSQADLETLLVDCDFLSLVERPGLLRGGLPWVLEPGSPPAASI